MNPNRIFKIDRAALRINEPFTAARGEVYIDMPQAETLCGVSDMTIRALANEGILRGHQRRGESQRLWRFPLSEVQRIATGLNAQREAKLEQDRLDEERRLERERKAAAKAAPATAPTNGTPTAFDFLPASEDSLFAAAMTDLRVELEKANQRTVSQVHRALELTAAIERLNGTVLGLIDLLATERTERQQLAQRLSILEEGSSATQH